MRWTLSVVLAFLLVGVLPTLAAPSDWGCCITSDPVVGCFNGDLFSSQAEFENECSVQDGEIEGEGFTDSCGFSQCEIRCCCAGEGIINSGQINSNEDEIRITQAACQAKIDQGLDYSSEQLSAETCVEVCTGSPNPTGSGGEHTVSGKVINGSNSQGLSAVEVFIPIPEGSISTLTDVNGEYSLADVPEINTRVFAIHPSCQPGRTSPILINEDKTDVDITLNCELGACTHANPTVDSVQSIVGTDEISLTVSLQDSCQDFIQFEPFRCDDQFANCNPLPPTDSPFITDSGIEPETTYCYIIQARFEDTVTDSGTNTANCVTTGSSVCMNLPQNQPASWCGLYGETPESTVQAILHCNDQNILEPAPPDYECEEGEICSTSGGEPRCVPAPECEKCNGLLGLFSHLGLIIDIAGFERECGVETEMCFEDTIFNDLPTVGNTYKSCTSVFSCEEYASQVACEDNPCQVSDTCRWEVINEELGKGICLGDIRPSCESCDDVLGYCNKAACEAISSDCYFDGERNGMSEQISPKGCIHREDLACRYYDTQEDCTGGVDAIFDVTWDGDIRSGSNALLTPSQDLMELQTCSWIPEKDRCIKDANMRTIQDEDDCFENNRYLADKECFVDNKAPQTEFFALEPPVYGRHEIRTIPFAVYDESPVDLIDTFVCFALEGETCTPQERLSSMALPEEGAYTLWYYSIDANENAEEVTAYPETILVQDYGLAAIEDARLEER